MTIQSKQSLIDALTKSASNLNRIRVTQQSLKAAATLAEPDVVQSGGALSRGLDARRAET